MRITVRSVLNLQVLSDNQLTGQGLETLVPYVCPSKSLRSLDLSGESLVSLI